MNCTAAIINWNSGNLLRACIESVLATTPDVEVLVIDNASRDDSMELAEGYRNRVNFVRNSVNRGFAAAVNQAFQETRTNYLLILNPDIRVLPGSIQCLEDVMESQPRGGAVGGHAGEKYLPRRFPTVGSIVMENLGRRRHASPLPGAGRSPAPEGEAISVEQPAGAALMIRRDAFDDAGGFDERFHPAWYEDVDFCRRLKDKGWEIYFAPRARFLHAGGYSVEAMGNEDFVRAYYTNQARYAQKHFGITGATVVRSSIAAGMIGRMIGKPKQAVAYGKALLEVLKGS